MNRTLVTMLTIKILFKINSLQEKLFCQNTIYNSFRLKKKFVLIRKNSFKNSLLFVLPSLLSRVSFALGSKKVPGPCHLILGMPQPRLLIANWYPRIERIIKYLNILFLHQLKVVKPAHLRTRCLQNATYAGLPKIQKLGLACRTVKNLTSLQRIDTA